MDLERWLRLSLSDFACHRHRSDDCFPYVCELLTNSLGCFCSLPLCAACLLERGTIASPCIVCVLHFAPCILHFPFCIPCERIRPFERQSARPSCGAQADVRL